MKIERLQGIVLQVFDPSVVALSAPGEIRWGHHQFPTISRLPDGLLLVTFNDRADRDDAYGSPGPAYVSSDEGMTWNKWETPDPLLSVSHSVISEINDGQYLCAPMSPSLDIEKSKIKLPELSGKMDVYGEVLLYELSACPADVQTYMATLPGARWIPEERRWHRDKIGWETKDALIRTRTSDHVISRPYLDNRVLKFNGMLYYADFHLQYFLPDRVCPKNYASWCMISKDNGYTWQRQGLIAHDLSGERMMGEPCIFPTANGNLACVIRCADQHQKSLLITYSEDGGVSWSKPIPIHDFGVMPQALLMENGVSVLSFGRPGVDLMFSPDGMARQWVGPLRIIAGDAEAINEHSCGYTRLLAVSDNAFLLVYSNFKHVSEDGRVSKAILVQKVILSRPSSPAIMPDAGDGQ